MRLKYSLIFSFFLLIGCASQQPQYSNRINNEYYVPSDWDKPISTENRPEIKAEKETVRSALDQTKDLNKTEESPEQMTGQASWYGPGFHGKDTANGETYNQNSMTAAHKILPMNTWVKVTNLENQKNIIVRINDRGPYKKDRILDLSKKAATKLDFMEKGTARVSLEVIKYPIGFDPAEGLKPYKQAVIQIAVFNAQQRADKYKSLLENRYKKLNFLIDEQLNGSYHVVAGPYDDRSKAVTVANDLKSEGVDSFVRSYKK